MREIIFRGKRADNGEWVYGYIGKSTYGMTIFSNLYHVDGGEWNIENEDTVLPDTVGQYTGLTDKNGKKIFEGDIVEYRWKSGLGNGSYYRGVVSYEPPEWMCGEDRFVNDGDEQIIEVSEHRIIGNIHDNKELLKEQQP